MPGSVFRSREADGQLSASTVLFTPVNEPARVRSRVESCYSLHSPLVGRG
jgi:hypothetical protein